LLTLLSKKPTQQVERPRGEQLALELDEKPVTTLKEARARFKAEKLEPLIQQALLGRIRLFFIDASL